MRLGLDAILSPRGIFPGHTYLSVEELPTRLGEDVADCARHDQVQGQLLQPTATRVGLLG